MKRLKLQLPADNPMDNNKAQALELINDVERSLEIIEQLLRDGIKDERAMPVHPRAGTGSAITEAPRGLLIHSYTYDDEGRIVSADVFTPTSLNAASIELHLRRAVEQCADRDEAVISQAPADDRAGLRSVHLLLGAPRAAVRSRRGRASTVARHCPSLALILGLGNPLMSDDGVGVRAAEILAADPELTAARRRGRRWRRPAPLHGPIRGAAPRDSDRRRRGARRSRRSPCSGRHARREPARIRACLFRAGGSRP